MPSSAEIIGVDDNDVDLYLALPDGSGPFAAVVVIQHASGVDSFTRTMADRLATAGFAAAAPDLYHRLTSDTSDKMAKLRQLKDREMISDVEATVEFLRNHSAIDGSALGITGFCMGGRVAYLMAAAIPQLKAAVAYYGGNIMVPWGEAVEAPYVRTEEIGCPLMFHIGEDDTNPSPDDMRKLDAELTRCNKAHEFYSYPHAGHAFMDFTREERYQEEASDVSWSRTVGFLAKHLCRLA